MRYNLSYTHPPLGRAQMNCPLINLSYTDPNTVFPIKFLILGRTQRFCWSMAIQSLGVSDPNTAPDLVNLYCLSH